MIKIYNEDCFVKLKELIEEGIKVDAIICDPPYNISYAKWDTDFNLEEAVLLCKNILKENANFIVFQGWSNVCETKAMLDKHFKLQNWIVWDRIKGRGATKNLVSTREDILWYCNGTNPTFNKIPSNIVKKTLEYENCDFGTKNGQSNRALTNVWYDINPVLPWSKEKNGHPTQKPLELMERCVRIWTNANDIVLDFSMGSGTTGVACKSYNRNFIGIEKDNHWFQVASQRLI